MRLVLLGASNLTLGLAPILEIARRRAGGGPLEVLMAAGHGRCYGRESRFLARKLPPILDCGLWRAAARPRPTLGLVTDIGNDLMQGASAQVIFDWITACVERLQRLGAETVLTLAPERSLERLDRLRYALFRSLLYPGRRFSLETVRQRTAAVNRLLEKLEGRPALTLATPSPQWFGVDGIHFRRRGRRSAWQSILEPWPQPEGAEPAEPPPPRRIHLRGGFERSAIFGVERRRRQPSAALADGSTLSLF